MQRILNAVVLLWVGCFWTTLPAHAETLTIQTLAGAPTGEFDGPGAQALFNAPRAIAIDAAGNVLVADSSNNTIRKVTPAGQVSTLAGQAPASGFADGSSGSALFFQPMGLAVDKAGNIFVADTGNNTIRKITPANVVSTFAGSPIFAPGSQDGLGQAARFNYPNAIAVDASGVLYVADSFNNTIRKITPDGTVSTLAGAPGQFGSSDGKDTGRFNNPQGVAVSKSGIVYVCDTDNHTIRAVSPDGTVSTLAGKAGVLAFADGAGSQARFDRPEGVTVDAAGNLFVADSDNSRIRKITPDGTVSTFGGGAEFDDIDGPAATARFDFPTAVAFDPQGNLIVADYYNNSIRKIDPQANVTTLAGPRNVRAPSQPHGVIVAPDGSVFFTDSNGSTVRKLAPDGTVTIVAGKFFVTGYVNGPSSQSLLDTPVGIVRDASGNIFISDMYDSDIRKIATDGTVSLFSGKPLFFGTSDGSAKDARFNGPQGMAIAADGSIYVADTNNHSIRKVALDGSVSTFAGLTGTSGNLDGTGSNARFNYPRGIAIDSAGTLYVADTYNYSIRTISPAGVVTTLAGSSQRFGSFDGPANQASFELPEGIAVGDAGVLYVADSYSHLIRKVTPFGVVSTLAGVFNTRGASDGTGSYARFFQPRGLAYSGGKLYIADSSNNLLRVGTAALNDFGTIDAQFGDPKVKRQLDVLNKSATTFAWRILLQPPGSTATLSNPALSNPTFTPDLPGVYKSELKASTTQATSITRTLLEVLPQPIVIDTVLSLDNPGFLNGTVRYAVRALSTQASTLNYSLDFGDGSPPASGSGAAFTYFFPSHVYSSPGDYKVVLSASDGITSTNAPITESVPAPNSGAAGVQNVGTGDQVVNPVDKTMLGINASNGGVIQAATNLDDAPTGGLLISTDFTDVPGKSARVLNSRPVHKFTTPGIFVATTTATASNGAPAGKARKMIVIGSKETGLQTVGGIGDAPDSVLIPNVIKGQFSFTETKNDLIFFSASFKLPANYKPDSAHPFSFGIGNIISSTMLDSKGKGTTPGSPAVIKSLKVLIRGIPKGGATKGGEMATVSATLSRSGLVAAGFDTEGITNRSTDAFPGGPSVPRKIQTVLLLDGVPYRALVPVDLTISSHGDFGVISGRAQK